jgi:hypothetical protein
MMFGFGSAFVCYLAAAGLATNAAVVGRGLVGSARLATQGRLAETGAQALASFASPVVMAAASAGDLVGEVIDAARELSRQALRGTKPTLHSDRAA